MRVWWLSILLLLTAGFTLSTTLEPWHQAWEGGRTKTDNVIQVALGDSRQLFARHFFLKADAYFHNGYYPTIYDNKQGYGNAHLANPRASLAPTTGSPEEDDVNFLGPPRDWIDRFSRNFYPSRHTHLGEGKCDEPCQDPHHHHSGNDLAQSHPEPEMAHNAHHDDPDGPATTRGADEREILPWLKVSLELDPKRVQTYVVAAFWLRTTLHEVDQAERLLRDGLWQVPNDPELLFELGRVLVEERHDIDRGRNVWERGLESLAAREPAATLDKADVFLKAQLLGNLATLEEKAGRPQPALAYLQQLAAISPNKESIGRWMDSIQKEIPKN